MSMATGIFRGIFCLLLAAALCGAQRSGRRSDNAVAVAGLARVDSLIAVEKLDEAVSQARMLWEHFAESPLFGWQCAGRLGLALHRDGQSAEALQWLEITVGLEPLSAEGHLNLAAALMALGRRGRAYGEYQTAVDLAPDKWRVRLDFGQALVEFRQYSKAQGHLQVAYELCGECPEATRALAALAVNRGDFAVALPFLETLFASGADESLRPLLARARYEAGYEQECLDLLVSFWPDSLSIAERGLVLTVDRRLGYVERAVGLAAGLAGGRSEPDDPIYWSQVVQICLDAGRFVEALAANERALELVPEDVVLLTNEAALLQRVGRDDEADHWLERAQRIRDRAERNP